MVSKVIIVTGANRGIGLAAAKFLLKGFNKVVLVSRSTDQLQALKEQYPSQVEYLAADLTLPDTASKATQLALKSFGALDGLVINHAMIAPMTRLENSSIDEWKQLYEANVFSALALVKETIPHLRATKGRVIFVSSGAALHAYTSWGAYGSSKAAMNSICQHLAVEVPAIVAVAVSPGRVDTDMQKKIREDGGAETAMAPEDYADFKAVFEEGRLNKPEWPGNFIAQLALEAKPELSGKYVNWNAPDLAEYRIEL